MGENLTPREIYPKNHTHFLPENTTRYFKTKITPCCQLEKEI